MEKHIVTPSPVVPARELLGEMLLEVNRPADALQAFESSAEREPNRLRGLYGAARSAELSGDQKNAKERYSELLQLCGHSEAQRLEVQNAQAYLEKP